MDLGRPLIGLRNTRTHSPAPQGAASRPSAIICSHFFTTGPANELEDFLRPRTSILVSVFHPFYFSKLRHTFGTIYRGGSPEKTLAVRTLPRFGFLNYLRDFAVSLTTPLRLKRRFDLFIGSNPLNAFAGVLLRRLGFARRVVFYKIDYVPLRFSNSVLNSLYGWIDRKCATDADWTWNLAEAMLRERRKQGIKSDNQIIVPIGCHFERIRRPSLTKIDRSKLVYMGSLRKGQGIELALDTFPTVLEKLPQAQLVIVGSGPLQQILKARVKELGLSQHVSFTGEVQDHQQVEQILTTCGIGLATYQPLPESFTYFTEPGKVKVYLACGLPVIITAVPEIAEEVRKRGAGMVIDYNSDNLLAAVVMLARNEQSYALARDSALSFASEFTWERVFTRAFAAMSSNVARFDNL